MRKLYYILATVVVGAVLAMFVINALQGTAYVRSQGREGTLTIAQRFSESRWARPLPLKRTHVYTGVFEPRYEVIVTSDQELEEGRSYSIRFLTRDKAADAGRLRVRPIPGSIRLRSADDPAPVKKDATAPMERLFNKAMGATPSPAGSETVSPASPGVAAASVPFLLLDANESYLEVLWNNSRPGEWVFLLLALLLFNALGTHAWNLPWKKSSSRADQKDFVHPSLRPIDPDPVPTPRPPIGFNPGAGQPQEPPPLPPSTPGKEPVLKLRRK